MSNTNELELKEINQEELDFLDNNISIEEDLEIEDGI